MPCSYQICSTSHGKWGCNKHKPGLNSYQPMDKLLLPRPHWHLETASQFSPPCLYLNCERWWTVMSQYLQHNSIPHRRSMHAFSKLVEKFFFNLLGKRSPPDCLTVKYFILMRSFWFPFAHTEKDCIQWKISWGIALIWFLLEMDMKREIYFSQGAAAQLFSADS